MLAKNKNPKVSYVSRLLALPLAAIIFFAFTLKVNSEKSIPIYNGKTINVIIDAGHGGYDVGAKGGNIYEKDLSLAIAKKIKELNSNKNINIILSRDNDEFISVKDRAKLATEKKADLFISIHLDAEQDQNKNNGMTILIPGNDYKYLNQSKLLASSIYESFKNNYALKVASDLMQRQRGLVVLNENTCPAILIEAGFITTQKDLAYLTQSANQEKIALNILNGIENYAQQESSVTINNLQTQDTIPAIYYNNKKLSAVKYLDPSNNIQATYADGSKETMTKEEALKRGFIPPPPPPGLPPYYFKTNMLFVVNGKISTRDIAKNIKPKEITDIYILNEEKGIGKYGDKGKNGVIELTTKHDDDHIHLEADSIFIRTNNADKTSSDWLVNNNSILESSNNSPEPLIIFDGKEISKDEMKNISPNSIQSLDVLKNESAKIYGEKGRNGVFIITSRDFHDQSLKDTIPDKIFQKVEVEASFPGGPNAWRDYIIKKIQAAIDTFTNKDYGTCVVRFVVRTDGSVSNVEATTMKGTLLAKIAMDAIKNGPKWIPASQQGKKVNAYRLQPVTLTNPEKPKKIESSTSQNSKSNAVISKPDQFAQFPGGSSSWLAYITRVLQKNSNNLIAKNSNGTCKIKFLVKKDGSISNVEAINMQHTELAQVAMNAIKQGPKWIPAKLNNNTVDSYLIQPVSFIVKDNLLNKEPN